MRTRPSILSLTLRSIIMAVAVMGTLWAQTTGKIAGRVVDNATGDPIPGANILIDGTAMGAATDANGDYFILGIPPGTYIVRAQVIGFGTLVQSDVRVLLNLTTTLDFPLGVETIAGEEVEVIAVRPVVQPDVSANIANVRAEEIEYMPVAGVTEFINLQAGIEPGMRIRGMGTEGLAFVVDGMSMRDGRSNEPFSNISYTAISEVQIQTGGFNAEYGNLRAGLINVITKEPARDRYSADVLIRYSPPHSMNFGGTPKSDNAYWWRPFMDPAVRDIGTHDNDPDDGDGISPWDKYTRLQYPSFEGWNAVSGKLFEDEDLDNDLTPTQIREGVFLHHMRKPVEIDVPEMDVDLSVGGPLIPGLGSQFGDPRFLYSFRRNQDPYFYPQADGDYGTKANIRETHQFKLLVDIGQKIKLNLNGLYATNSGVAHSAFAIVVNPMPQPGGIPSYPWSPGWDQMMGQNDDHVGRSGVFGTDRWAVTDVTRQQFGGSLTHTLTPSTFYRVSVSSMKSDYDSHTRSRRSKAPVKTISTPGGAYELDEAPYGWTSDGTTSLGSGLRLGGHWARARDTSQITITTIKFDLTSQLNTWNQVKAGVELNLNDYDMHYASDDSVIVHIERSKQTWQRNATQAAFYLQNKLEFKGMIANVGLRLDYYAPGGDWWVYENWERMFSAANKPQRGTLEEAAVDAQVVVSPRIGVSFPITAASKLFFNYGHFRDVLSQRDQYEQRVAWQGDVYYLGSPDHPLLKSVAYELGYEHNLFTQYLLRVSGYYRDNSSQPETVEYISIDGDVDYYRWEPINYSDVRGVELTLNKTIGQYVRGFVNYTYHIEKSGNFGFREQHQNSIDQRTYALSTDDHYQDKPVANPFARFNLEFYMPAEFGPNLMGLYPLGDWQLSLLGSWRAGQVFTYAGRGGSVPGLEDNVRWKNYSMLDIRLSKDIHTGVGRAQIFADIFNPFNIKHMYASPENAYGGPFEGENIQDWHNYMESLHLDKDTFADIEGSGPYILITGDDRPGDYRKAGTPFVPIEVASNKDGLPSLEDIGGFIEADRRVLGWAADEEDYYELVNGSWQAADQGFVDDVLDNKQYIDMPNEPERTFLNPRSIMFGIRVWF